MRAPLALLAAACAHAVDPTDKGYELLFRDSLDECEAKPLTFTGDAIPDYVRGTFMQTGPARWTWKANETFTRKMTHALDGYGKLHRWEFKSDGSVAFTTKFLRSGFLNKSHAINDMAFQVMAQATDPPLPTPGLTEFMNTPNDNQNVNMFELGDGMQVMSDTATLVEVDPVTLETRHEYNGQICNKWNGGDAGCTKLANMTNPTAQVCSGGSAHPWRTESGDYLSLRETAKMDSLLPGKESLAVYTMKAGSRGTIQDVVPIKVASSSYTHSWGLAKGAAGTVDYAVIAQQPIHYASMNLVRSGTLDKGFKKTDDPTRFYIAPLEYGATPVELDAPEPFFFGHFVNSYSPAPGKFVADINMQDNIFFDRYDMTVQRTKALRDAWPSQTDAKGKANGYQTVTRYEIDTAARTVTAAPLFGVLSKDNVFNEHDLFRLHPADYGREYCGYWAWQAYYNSTSFASWAVVRTELCGAKPVVAAAWYRPNVYPGEATFVPKPGSASKTEGALLFKALDGNTGKSLLVVADATSLATIAEAELPVDIPFTVHGNWFPAK